MKKYKTKLLFQSHSEHWNIIINRKIRHKFFYSHLIQNGRHEALEFCGERKGSGLALTMYSKGIGHKYFLVSVFHHLGSRDNLCTNQKNVTNANELFIYLYFVLPAQWTRPPS